MGNRPFLQPNWGYDVARWNIRKLQPLRDNVQQLQQAGLTGADLLQTFINNSIQHSGDGRQQCGGIGAQLL
jgi:hypothetical protein